MNEVAAREQFIEGMGQITEDEGFPRIAGRVFGLLLLASEEMNLDEIAGSLSVSRASVSTDARRLSDCGILERVTRKGDRRDYYQVRPDHFSYLLEQRLAVLQRMTGVLSLGLELEGLPQPVANRLENSSKMVKWFLARAVQDLIDFRKEFLPEGSDTEVSELLAVLSRKLNP